MNKHSRQKAEQSGRLAETMAIWFLRIKGYRIVEQRFKSKVGEIDLIAKRGKTLVFIEVKYRKTGASANDVSPFQADRLVRAAGLYLALRPLPPDAQTRFDFILLGAWRWPRHIKGAFMADQEGMGSIS